MKKWWRAVIIGISGFLSVPASAQPDDPSVSNKGLVFWCAFMENLDLAFNDTPGFAFQIEAEQGAEGTVTLVGTGLSVPFSVAPGGVATVDLPTAIFYPEGSEAVTDFGFLISADDSIRVQALHWRQYFSETASLLPVQQLGSRYLAQCYWYQGGDESAFIVVATADNTLLTITPAALTRNGRPAGLPFSVQLNRGQTYQVQSLQDLAGTAIQSAPDKPVAVFGGAKISQVECHAANSHLYDQCLPLDRPWFWGKSFSIAPFYGQSTSVLRVLASEDSTLVQLDCDTVAMLQRGETWTHIFSAPSVLYACKPVAISQMTRGVECSGVWQNGDPSMLNLLPEEIKTQKAFVKISKRSSNAYEFTTNTLTLIARSGGIPLIRLNGSPLNSQPVFPIGPDREFARIFLLPDSVYLLESDNVAFQAYLSGLNYANAYGHWLSFDRIVLDTPAEVASLLAPDTVCVDSAFAVSAQGGVLQALEWLNKGVWQNLSTTNPLMLHEPGPVIFRAEVLVSGECRPRLVYAKTHAAVCPLPPDSCALRFPTAFTPDGDQLNDNFGPLPSDCAFAEYDFAVYNRWGQVVFADSRPFARWDGRMPGGQEAPADVFIWMLQYRRNATSAAVRLVGELSLLR